MSGENKLSLEEQYIEKAKEYFSDEELVELSEIIEKTIYETSSTVIKLYKNWWRKQVIAQKWDLSDHINQDLKNNTTQVNGMTFDDLVDNFIDEKIKIEEIKKTTVTQTNEILTDVDSNEKEKTIEEIEIETSEHILKIKDYLSIFNDHLKSFKSLIKLLNSDTLEVWKKMVDESISEFESYLPLVNQSQLKLSVNIIEIELLKTNSNLSPEKQNYLDDLINLTNDWLLSIEKIVTFIRQSITNIREKIDIIEANIWVKKQNDIDEQSPLKEEGDLERKYTSQILNKLSESWDMPSVFSAIWQLEHYLSETSTGALSTKEKIKRLENPLIGINTSIFEKDETVKKLFKRLVEIKVKKVLETIKEEDYRAISKIPKNCFTDVMMILQVIVKKYLENKQDEVGNKNTIKSICDWFIIELDNVDFFSYITERKDFSKIEVHDILPILLRLRVPANLHEFFYDIAEIYFNDTKEKIRLTKFREDMDMQNLELSIIKIKNLISALKIEDPSTINDCIENINLSISTKVLINIETERMVDEYKKRSKDVAEIAKRMINNRTKPKTLKSDNPIIIEAEKKSKVFTDKKSPNVKLSEWYSMTPLNEILLKETIEELMKPYVSLPDNIKVVIKNYIKSYYVFLKNVYLKNSLKTSLNASK